METGSKGVHYLDFCDDFRMCPFSVVVFPYDLKNIGDVRELAGKVVEIRGEIKEYDDRAEIILESRKQLAGDSASIPPMPKNFDVEQRGNFSAGKFRAPHSRSPRRKKHPNLAGGDAVRRGELIRLTPAPFLTPPMDKTFRATPHHRFAR